MLHPLRIINLYQQHHQLYTALLWDEIIEAAQTITVHSLRDLITRLPTTDP